MDELGGLAALREADRAEVPRDELGQEPRPFSQRAGAELERLVEHRRVPEGDRPRRPRRPVHRHDGRVQPEEGVRELARVGDRRGGEEELRLGSVDRGRPAQPPQDVPHVRAEHAPVDVRLVDHHEAEVREHVGPAVVVREDADVEHVGVREDEVRPPPDVPAALGLRVAVVDRRAQTRQPQLAERAGLVLRQRLRRVEVERPHLRVGGDGVQHGEVEGERLPARRAGGDDEVLAPAGGSQGVRLVGVEALDAARRERGLEARVERGEGDRLRLGSRHLLDVRELLAREEPFPGDGGHVPDASVGSPWFPAA